MPPHIHLRNLSDPPVRFEPYVGGSNPQPKEIGDRAAHAARLRKGLSAIEGELPEHVEAQRAAGVAKKDRGLTIVATGIGRQDLWLGELKVSSPGLSLMAASHASQDRVARARLFVNAKALETLQRQLDDYSRYVSGPVVRRDGDDDSSKPRRFTLFESVSDFSVAGVEDMWVAPDGTLPPEERQNVEVWLRADRETHFDRILADHQIVKHGSVSRFASNIVLNASLSTEQMADLMKVTGAVIEYRPASEFIGDFLGTYHVQGKQAGAQLAKRLIPAPPTAPRTVILDSGVTAANPLLRQSLPNALLRTIDGGWGAGDETGHGTAMAGVALYPNLEEALSGSGSVPLTTGLESVKILRSMAASTELVAPRDALERAVAQVETVAIGPRVYSLSATIPGEECDGRQSATSGMVDKLAWGGGDRTRLFCVAAGNVPHGAGYLVAHYQNRNKQFPIQSPAQAINALTVGAYTGRIAKGGPSVAKTGDLCPVSRTSQSWLPKDRSANKPDVVFEGGNHLLLPGGNVSNSAPDTGVVTTGNDQAAWLTLAGETSAATAGVAGIATRLLARHPRMRAETVRGMIVNGAAWTPAMHAQSVGGPDAVKRALDRFGWGVPDEKLIQESSASAVSLVIEDEITPFELRKDRIALKEMKYFDLPWPKKALAALGTSEVELACTLSYFAEPDPLADKRGRRDRYASHRLRFRLNQPGDTASSAQGRLTKFVDPEDDAAMLPSEGDANWVMDWRRCELGTLHHNIWRGPAYDLAVRGGICVYPVKGWWTEQKSEQYQRAVPFSLIISIRTASTDVDLYGEIKAAVAARASVSLVEV